MSRAELKARAKDMLRGNWGTAIAVMLVQAVIMGLGSRLGPPLAQSQVEGIHVEARANLLMLVISGALSVGICGVYLSFLREGKAEFSQMFDGFTECFVASLIANLVMGFAVGLGCVLLLIPGIVLSLMFSQTFFILRDHPDLSGIDAMMASKDMMAGHKGEYFVLMLSFIPWFMLCVFVLPIFYVVPYFTATMTAYYDQLSAENQF